ncbi:MAG TPA: (Fe-S)-binding protein [Candidatus Nitrosotalea sp.]|nr:(Fe-S)-binding protein [Candidatus Nitrosotalea sp.]
MPGLDIRDPTTFQGPDAPADDDLSTCVHCGLCLNYCPTFRMTGLESESPRGRLYLMSSWQRGDLPFTPELARHIDLCLGCRTCEAVCPSGVPYGRIIEGGRAELERLRPPSAKRWLLRRALRDVLAHPGRLRVTATLARATQRLGLDRALPPAFRLPPLQAPWRRPRARASAGPAAQRRVAFLEGCVMPLVYGRAHDASIKLLRLAGCEVVFPADQRCCGALNAHNGDLEGARHLRAVNQAAFGVDGLDAIVVNSAGCGAHMKDFYKDLGVPVKDLFEYLDEIGLPAPSRPVKVRVAYQDACHLAHAQGVKVQPRRLLASLPQVEIVSLQHPDICCGGAGLYSSLETAMSDRILAEKMDDVLETGPAIVVVANPGCQMQLERGLAARRSKIRVLHLAELLAQGYPDPD